MLHQDFAVNCFGFVAGHGALELTAIMLAGVAGFKVGLAWLWPGQKSRLQALKDAGQVALKITYGYTTMLFFAAFIEAFWSSSQGFPLNVKLFIGGAITLLLFSYFVLCGRRYES